MIGRSLVYAGLSDMDAEKRILVVEDDPTLCEMLQLNLELEGYTVDTAFCAEDALRLDISRYSLILLDVMMKEINGFRMARMLKDNPATAGIPIIFCTARDNEDDMLTGLGIGADDYIYKPYTIRNVLMRVKTVLRRSSPSMDDKSPAGGLIKHGAIMIDASSKKCLVDGKDAGLVKKEFEILSLLMQHPGVVFSRQDILDKVWRDESVVFDRTVDVNITRLRRKIAPYGDRIITRQGFGYGFE